MNNISTIKSQILEANNLYRVGKPIMTDQEFDDLCKVAQEMMNDPEWNEFRNSLHEEEGKVVHPFIMGSLDKIKAEEPETAIKFLNNNICFKLNVSAKVDGISCRLHYSNGKLISGSTRGNGYKGEDISDKVKFIKGIPQIIDHDGELDIRGELVILKEDFEHLEGFANPRNATAGIMNRKEWTKEEVQNISFVCYTILGKNYSKKDQFDLLERLGFTTTYHVEFDKSENTFDDDFIKKLYEIAQMEHTYECDGLVLSDSNYINEDSYRPEQQVAFKINQLSAMTHLVDVDFSAVSKEGKICPVGILDPVEIGGSTICRVTLYNLDFIEKMNLKYGSLVKITKSGDVIPKLIEATNDESCIDIQYPSVCPVCGEPLVRKGIDIYCVNENCSAQVSNILTMFIKKLDIKNASNASLDNFGIKSFEDILKFIPNPKYKNEMKLYSELEKKLFHNSKRNVFLAFNFTSLSKVNLNKVIDHYGFDFILSNPAKAEFLKKGLPSGIGEITLDKFLNDLPKNIEYLNMFVSDSRYAEPDESNKNSNSIESSGMSICFTGSLNTMGRGAATKLAEEVGFQVLGGVTKSLTYLVMADPNSNSGKAKKAREYGTKVIGEDEFLAMVKSMKPESRLDDL